MVQTRKPHLHLRGTPWRCLSVGVALAIAVFAAILPGTAVPPAHATDAAVIDTSGGQQQRGRFLRLGLAKSAILKLPAEAKDVIVGENSIVDVMLRNKNTAYLFARRPGQTNLFFFDGEGREILHLDLEVTLDSKGLKELLDRNLPNHRIEVDSTGENVVLKGMVASAQEAKIAEQLASRFYGGSGAVLNLIKVAQGDQVMLKVKVVELNRSAAKRLGVNLAGTLSVGSVDAQFNTLTSEVGSGILDSSIEMLSGGNSIDVQVQALEEQGLATILAEPTLTAISGAAANFQAGGEFPYRECRESEGVLLCEIQFKPYGVTLGFTPTVLSENRIALNIATEVSELGERTLGIPAINTRKAQTSVEIPSGGSMMMAGLIKDVTTQDLSGVPGLKSLPVLGALFTSRDYQSKQTELVVIVTPYIARPVQRRELATPLDRFNAPTDLQQIFLGRLNRIYGLPGNRPEGVYHGKVGHIID